ncbi:MULTISPECIES: tryptophan 2,3-dioxygenase [Streptomyces]|uniref:Tryptophan 2,3-dioxygenase n=1 Tax=Streptomyces griseiscabiei TaxID=2993540 RepID=A0ABU4L1Z6_9ACTN|nr:MULTISPECIES: tryptophan 2,3-dioxygenase family protein [Streptomyces]MBZ3906077.1 tryptophan 2,3-dioxygenase [Streptomyces griseiscabiei]MDX2909711.1 tryptophan 2,3-dioxygenase family protein [Streptomyces griseiscabiei]
MTDTTSLPCDPGTDDPLLSFTGRTPYDDYVHASVLSSLQQPLTNDPNEMPFLVTTQVMELWFTLVVHEWRAAQDHLAKDDLERAMDALRRSISAHHALNDSLGPIARMTPAQFNGFREAFGAASGFQSAKYRQLEFLLGDKSRSLMNPQRADPGAYAELEDMLNRPSLYDAALGYLHRRGLPVPESVLRRDVTVAYEADPGVAEAWLRIYSGPQNDPLMELGEALTDIAELVLRWRGDHLLATRRAMGSKAGSGGSSGVEWLEKRAARPVFPELWTARGHV